MLKNASQHFYLIKVTKIFLNTTLSIIEQFVNKKAPNLSYKIIFLTQASNIKASSIKHQTDSVLSKYIEFTPYGDYSSNTNLVKISNSSETAAI